MIPVVPWTMKSNQYMVFHFLGIYVPFAKQLFANTIMRLLDNSKRTRNQYVILPFLKTPGNNQKFLSILLKSSYYYYYYYYYYLFGCAAYIAGSQFHNQVQKLDHNSATQILATKPRGNSQLLTKTTMRIIS